MKKFVLITGLLVTPVAADQAAIDIDGRFADWSGITPAVVDPIGDVPPGALDIGRVWLADDPDRLAIRIEASAEFALADRDTLRILIDTDNDASTGYLSGGFGAELYFDFGDLEGRFFATTTTNPSSGVQIWHSDFGLQGQPTVTSDEFEIALARDATIEGTNLFNGSTIRIRLVDDGGERIPDTSIGIEYELDAGTPPDMRDESIGRQQPTDVRHISWNVRFDSPWDQALRPSFGRILAALDADIMSFQEIYDHDGDDVVDFVDDWVQADPSGTWHVASNYDCHTVSRYPVLASEAIDGNLAVLLDTTSVLDRTTLIINAHLSCCDNDQSRQQEIDRILRFIRQVRNGQQAGYPIDCALIITGDLNLVGLAQQLDSLIEGDIVDEATYGSDVAIDVDGTELRDVICLQTDARLAYTWRNDFGWYWPGRLDFTILSDSVLEVGTRVTIETDRMSPEKRSEYGLFAADSACSDHRPLVTDLRVPGCPGDLDGNGRVDGGDLSILLSDWGDCDDPDECVADLNADAVINGGDLSIILGFWGPCS
ncbi:MAG: endonuclease/exonuclease/phosphatase family protein [Phycisphaerales bacterium]|jgi:hypothetical protein|nr:endonuclease/exonuclease/phosphatase family protein [Phycisphaerales bacterium]